MAPQGPRVGRRSGPGPTPKRASTSPRLTAVSPVEVSTDALVVTAFEDGLSPQAEAVDAALDGVLTEMRDSGEFRGRFAERIALRTLGRLPAAHVLLLGLGRPRELDLFRLTNAFQFAADTLRSRRAQRVAAYLDPQVVATIGSNGASPSSLGDAVRAIATGILLSGFDQDTNKSDPETRPRIELVELGGVEAGAAAVERDLEMAEVLAEATNRVRAWGAAPSNLLTPTALAESARRLFEGTGLELDVLEKADLQREGMGALLGVAQGSDEPPVMITVRYDGGPVDGPRLALVGKGITFDTGGISLKPPAGMDLMRDDMSGGAAVLAAMWAIARLRPPVNVVGVVPATENMPSGHAYKPGDVLVSSSGKTIEVIDTDAEGRIILADGLTKARRLGATHIVDVATLTGSAVVALGHSATALMSNDESLTAMVKRAAHVAGDRVAELPMFPEYAVALESRYADVRNVGQRPAGTINAAFFLREFVEELPWVHLDIAGSSWNSQSDQTQIPSGPSGAPVRTLVHLAFEFAELNTSADA